MLTLFKFVFFFVFASAPKAEVHVAPGERMHEQLEELDAPQLLEDDH